jgi:hypothetical protein
MLTVEMGALLQGFPPGWVLRRQDQPVAPGRQRLPATGRQGGGAGSGRGARGHLGPTSRSSVPSYGPDLGIYRVRGGT